MKINQLTYFRDLLEQKHLSDCKLINIPLNKYSIINIEEPDDYKKINLK